MTQSPTRTKKAKTKHVVTLVVEASGNVPKQWTRNMVMEALWGLFSRLPERSPYHKAPVRVRSIETD